MQQTLHPTERESVMDSFAAVLASLPAELALEAFHAAAAAAEAAELPEVVAITDGDALVLACPWAECDGTQVNEVDYTTRSNEGETWGDDGAHGLAVSQPGPGESEEWTTIAYVCRTCERPVTIPGEVTVSFG